jgi:hypothetical protein
MWVVKMRVQDLLAVCERPVESLADDLQVLVELLVWDIMARLAVGHFDLAIELGSIYDGCKAAAAHLMIELALSMAY